MVTRLPNCSAFEDKLPIFGTEAFLKSRSGMYGWIGDDNYVIAYVIDKRLVFRRLIFTCEPTQLTCGDTRDYTQFLEDVVALVEREIDVDFIAKPQSNVVLSSYPSRSEHVGWGSYRLDLNRFDTDEELMQIIHQKHRNVIRKAAKDGVVVGETNDLDKVYRCIRETFERQDELLFPSKEYLRRLRDNLGSQLLCFKADFNGELQGVAVIPFNQAGGFYYYGGSCAKPYAGSLNLMHYVIINSLKSRGVRMYDFMGARLQLEKGSKYEGIQRFKSRFGGQLIQGYTFRQVLKPFKYWLFECAVKTYYRINGTRYPGDLMDQVVARQGSGWKKMGQRNTARQDSISGEHFTDC
jgi:hypothetical protein